MPPFAANVLGKPVYFFNHGAAGVSIFMREGNSLTVKTPGGRYQTLLSPVAGELSIIGLAENRGVMVWADGDGPFEFVAEKDAGGWERCRAGANWRGPSLTAVGVAVVEQIMPSRRLKNSYSPSQRHLDATDISTLSADYREAYAALVANADSLGAFIQPIVARCRLVDADGSTVYSTPPVLVTPSAAQPLQCTSVDRAMSQENGGLCLVAPTALRATAFRIRVSWPETLPGERVDHAVVELSRQVEPYSAKARCVSRLTFPGTDTGALKLALPGMTLAGDVPGRVRSAIINTAMAMDTNRASAVTVRQNADGSWPEIIAGSDAPVPTDVPRHALGFIPAVVGGSGDVRVFADVTLPVARCVSPGEYSADAPDNTDVGWSGSVAVTCSDMVDGERRKIVGTFRGRGAIAALSPLVCHSDASAIEMSVAVGTRRATIPLSATPDGSMAYYLAPDLKPVSLVAGQSAVVPADNPGVDPRYPGMVVIADSRRPLVPLCRVSLPDGVRVISVAPAARSKSSWDFGRAHFYLFTTAGIYAMAVNSSRTRVGLALIDSRMVTAWSLTPVGVMAVAGVSLIRLNGAGVTDVAVLERAAVMTGWNSELGELWVADADGRVTVGDSGWNYPFIHNIQIEALAQTDNGLLAVSGTSAYHVGAEEIFNVPVNIATATVFTGINGRPRRVTWNISASEFSGSLSLVADGGAAGAMQATVTRLDVKGALNCPVSARIITPHRRRFTAGIEGLVSADCVINPTELV